MDDVDAYLKKYSFTDMRSVEQGGDASYSKSNQGNNVASELTYEERKKLMKEINYLERDRETEQTHW